MRAEKGGCMRRVLASVLFSLALPLLVSASTALAPGAGFDPILRSLRAEDGALAFGWHLPRVAGRELDHGPITSVAPSALSPTIAPPAASPAPRVLAVLAEGIASHYLGPDDRRPINPLTGGRVERAAEAGYMVDETAPTAAMKKIALGTKVRVTNLRNGRSIVVRINDRGPYRRNRVIDLTHRAFREIADDPKQGLLPRVRVERVPDDTPTSWPEPRLSVREWNDIRKGRRRTVPAPPVMIAANPVPAKAAPAAPAAARPLPAPEPRPAKIDVVVANVIEGPARVIEIKLPVRVQQAPILRAFFAASPELAVASAVEPPLALPESTPLAPTKSSVTPPAKNAVARADAPSRATKFTISPPAPIRAKSVAQLPGKSEAAYPVPPPASASVARREQEPAKRIERRSTTQLAAKPERRIRAWRAEPEFRPRATHVTASSLPIHVLLARAQRALSAD